MIIDIADSVVYDTEKVLDNQTIEFQEYFWNLYNSTPKIPYPNFDLDGNISYQFSDMFLNYSVKRVQVNSNSTSNRAVKELLTEITVK